MSTAGAHTLEKALTKGSDVHKLVVMVGASWDDVVYQEKRLERGGERTYISSGPSLGTFSLPSMWTAV
jgi:hypothetical protein